MNDLSFAWLAIIAFGIIMYILLDGFDLGIGMLSLINKSDHDRDLMISSILPVWDGNETWLVFGGATLYGAFPLAFSQLLPALYIPILLMILALIFRGVAFEFRLKAIHSKKLWDLSLFFGSLVTTIMQGFILSVFVMGFQLVNGQVTIPYHDYYNPFSFICIIALIFGYMLLGSNWLIMKTTGELQNKFFRYSSYLQYGVIIFVILVSIYSPFLNKALLARWFDTRYILYLAMLPIVTLLLFYIHIKALKNRREILPFLSSLGIFICCYIGFIISSYPYLVPKITTYQQAAASDYTLRFMLIGACILLPTLLFYTFYAYYLFRGKITEKIKY